MSGFDFEAALAAKVTPDEGQVAEETVAEEAEAVEEEVVEEEAAEEEPAERTRDEKGRFAPLKQEDLATEIQAYLDAHGGDVAAALRDATEAQKVIGRQGSELGDLRKAVENIQAEQGKPRVDQT